MDGLSLGMEYSLAKGFGCACGLPANKTPGTIIEMQFSFLYSASSN